MGCYQAKETEGVVVGKHTCAVALDTALFARSDRGRSNETHCSIEEVSHREFVSAE
jgi:hypothetical protein